MTLAELMRPAALEWTKTVPTVAGHYWIVGSRGLAFFGEMNAEGCLYNSRDGFWEDREFTDIYLLAFCGPVPHTPPPLPDWLK